MKTPQRKFVVEFKSGRRQPRAPTNSIWGDTDFKALAREVEDKTSHLFNANEAPGAPDEGGNVLPDPLSSRPASEHGGDADFARATMRAADGSQVEVLKQQDADRPAADVAAQAQESQPMSQPPRPSPRPSGGTPHLRAWHASADEIARIAMDTNEAQSAQSKTARDPISFDEVAALDAENKRLRRLLAEHLHAQNLQLKKMLARFGVV
ncbi:hypothetical protein LJR255_005265 [Pararhizobium sp. LjRoot255]|jgi:hypothetical protein|uniref:hypothetical protein n=1 Tax=Pararhizobium sp. LjRoot255 TaxID=3342298 RepID=UPI003ECDB073